MTENEKAWKDIEIEKLRDQFAMAALTGIISSPLLEDGISDQTFAKTAYDMADAMLQARAKPEGE